MVDGVRAVFRGEMASSDAAHGMALTLALVAIGIAFGARVFRRESA